MAEPPPIGYHVMCHLDDGRVIARTRRQRLEVSRIVLTTFRGHGLLAFNAPDTHLHIEHVEKKAVGNKLVGDVLRSIKPTLKLPVGFAKPFPKPIRSQAHLFNAFDYILKQQPHHELEWDPHREASNLPDLLGLRMLGQSRRTTCASICHGSKRALLLGHLGLEALDEGDGPLEELLLPRSRPLRCATCTAAAPSLARPAARRWPWLAAACHWSRRRCCWKRTASPSGARAGRLRTGASCVRFACSLPFGSLCQQRRPACFLDRVAARRPRSSGRSCEAVPTARAELGDHEA